MNNIHEKYMRLALQQAQESAAHGEVPVGCVIIDSDGEIIGKGQNDREARKSALGHADRKSVV